MTKKQKSEIFLKNLKVACAKKGVSVSQMMKDLGMSTSTPSNWKKEGRMPNGDTLHQITEYLEVTVDALMVNVMTAKMAGGTDTETAPETHHAELLPNRDLSATIAIIQEQQAQLVETNRRLLDALDGAHEIAKAAQKEVSDGREAFLKSLSVLSERLGEGYGEQALGASQNENEKIFQVQHNNKTAKK